jgi:hypothetical protein
MILYSTTFIFLLSLKVIERLLHSAKAIALLH